MPKGTAALHYCLPFEAFVFVTSKEAVLNRPLPAAMLVSRALRLFSFVILAATADVVLSSNEQQCIGKQCINAEDVVTMDADTETATTTTIDSDVDGEKPNCPSREYVIRCSGEYLDTNKNGLLERTELQAAIDALPW